MNRHILVVFVVASSSIITLAAAQETDTQPSTVKAVVTPVEAKVEAVTMYLGRASVTRRAELTLNPGVYDLVFSHLPEAVQSDSLQARAEGPAKVLGVQFEEKPVAEAPSAKVAALDAKIQDLMRSLEMIAEQHKINAAQGKFIDDISVRMSDDASKVAGSPQLELAALREQIAFVAEERAKLATRRLELDAQKRGLDEQLRILQAERQAIAGGAADELVAVVTAVVTAPSQVSIALTYLVDEATWQPKYNIRAAADGSSATIEYDALLAQRTGEDWDHVKLTLSTAQPTIAANPPSLQPWFVDIAQPMRGRGEDVASLAAPASKPAEAEKQDAGGGGGGRGGGIFGNPDEDAQLGRKLASLGESASVGGAGPSVTYQLPRLVTVKTDAQKQQTTRIASIDTQPKFVHIAVPALTEAVYIRGDLVNASAYQLLPGPAAIFVGQDYVGPTGLPAVAPQGEFKVHFGIDHAVKSTRQLLTKKTSKTGLFNGGLRTIYDYRMSIDNGAGKAINLELWDRIPVSRSSDIKIEAAELSRDLATDAEYVDSQKPQGLLKWDLKVPATATGKGAEVITYQLMIDRAADVQHTPLPE